MKNKLSPAELDLLVRAYDLVGDIAITIIPVELAEKEGLIGETILRLNKNIKVVAKRAGHYAGEFRTIPLTVIAGENRKETEHKEYGVRLRLNPEETYFSVRSGTERKRLATLVKPAEDVLVMFSGVGAFPLVIAKNSPAGQLIGIEKNLIAHEYAVHNLKINKKISNVTLLAGDVIDLVPGLGKEFDRVVMPLPKTGETYLDLAISALKKGGWLHFYDFQSLDSLADSVEKVAMAGKRNNRTISQTQSVICGHCGPGTYRICVDVKIA
ncbi:MAG: hypothetical protein KKB30_00285 [Proteobacteria bacterium]|nr:hypothetical protein [Pseudomonadota bacterium]MBU1716593.1 hypothetical protein [Pseudomonadota bacterium]